MNFNTVKSSEELSRWVKNLFLLHSKGSRIRMGQAALTGTYVKMTLSNGRVRNWVFLFSQITSQIFVTNLFCWIRLDGKNQFKLSPLCIKPLTWPPSCLLFVFEGKRFMSQLVFWTWVYFKVVIVILLYIKTRCMTRLFSFFKWILCCQSWHFKRLIEVFRDVFFICTYLMLYCCYENFSFDWMERNHDPLIAKSRALSLM